MKNSSAKQLDRFKQVARDLETDESDGALDRIMGKLDLTRKPDSESNDEGGKPKE